MTHSFDQKIAYWYAKSKKVLQGRKDSTEELTKRAYLLDNVEPNPNLTINMVSICGTYEVAGGNPDELESFYTGLLSIDLIDNQISATWLIEGTQQQTGYGFVFNNTLMLHFDYMVDEFLYNGIVAYEFITADIIIGKWTEEVAIENAFEMGRKLSHNELGEPYPEDYLSCN